MWEILWNEILKVIIVLKANLFNSSIIGAKEPRRNIPDDVVIFPDPASSIPDAEYIKSHFFEEGRLTEGQVLKIVRAGIQLLKSEPNLLILDAPATSKSKQYETIYLSLLVIGDIHGQYYDLIKMFQIAEAEPSFGRFLFLGDYVDRGYFSIECFVYLLALKLNYPDKVYLLRGNHECRHLTRHFTFRLECNYKYTMDVYEAVMLAFDALPLAAIVNKEFFCVHGGISPELKSIDDINNVNIKKGIFYLTLIIFRLIASRNHRKVDSSVICCGVIRHKITATANPLIHPFFKHQREGAHIDTLTGQ